MTARLLRPAALALVIAGLAGCSGDGYQPKGFTADDRCRSCEGGGLFSGPDGRFTVLGGGKRTAPAKNGGSGTTAE